MSILDTFQKNFDTLRGEYMEYKEYHDTMVTIIPSIFELLDSLFLEENIKQLENYKLLKEDYLDVIKRTLEPENYKDVKFEAELPDIYDAPRTRREKSKKITKLKQKKVAQPGGIRMPAPIIPNPSAPQAPRSTEQVDQSPNRPQIATEMQILNKALSTQIPRIQGQRPTEVKKVDKALQAFAYEGRRLYNYQSPLECEKKTSATAFPAAVLIELPDETKAYLHNDGKITDVNKTRELGNISEAGVITLNNAEFGRINLVDRNEEKFVPITNNFGKLIS